MKGRKNRTFKRTVITGYPERWRLTWWANLWAIKYSSNHKPQFFHIFFDSQSVWFGFGVTIVVIKNIFPRRYRKNSLIRIFKLIIVSSFILFWRITDFLFTSFRKSMKKNLKLYFFLNSFQIIVSLNLQLLYLYNDV